MSGPALLQDILVQGQHPEPRSTKIPLFSSLLLVFALLVRFWVKNLRTSNLKTQAASDQQNVVPSYVPIVGHHFSLLSSPAETLRNWARVHGDVFIVKLGSRRVTIVNSGRAARDIYARHSNALNSRPELWTYHNVSLNGDMSSTRHEEAREDH